MKVFSTKKNGVLARLMTSAIAMGLSLPISAGAVELNWSGQFWSEYHFIKNYTLNSNESGETFDSTRQAAGGYYIPGAGSNDATFQTLFLRLRPKLVVNDNIYIKSEFWLGNPMFSVFGAAYPQTADQRQWYSSQSRGSVISAQRFWGEFLSDFGTVQIGRLPLNWGLGLFWNSGENLWDRYQSTGDSVRLISKFGAFSFIPSFVLYSAGNNLGGSCVFNPTTGVCTPGYGSGGVADYSLALKYENPEEDFEAGVNFVKRLAAANQDPNSGVLRPLTSTMTPGYGLNFNTWDIYAKKKFGNVTLGGELPITSGKVGGLDYSTLAVATEVDWRITDMWETLLKVGYAPGQANIGSSSFNGGDSFKAFYFHPSYRIANIMFNYQLANLAGYPGGNTLNNPYATEQGQLSPFDNPITNATYISANGLLHTDKWTFNTGFTYAKAQKHAETGSYFWNSRTRSLSSTAAVKDQGSSLGFEWDTGAQFQWDEYFTFRLDLGLFFPGSYWKFSNTAVDNETSTVFSSAFRVGVNF